MLLETCIDFKTINTTFFLVEGHNNIEQAKIISAARLVNCACNAFSSRLALVSPSCYLAPLVVGDGTNKQHIQSFEILMQLP